MLGQVGVLGPQHAVLALGAVLLLRRTCFRPDCLHVIFVQKYVVLFDTAVEVAAHALVDVGVDELAQGAVREEAIRVHVHVVPRQRVVHRRLLLADHDILLRLLLSDVVTFVSIVLVVAVGPSSAGASRCLVRRVDRLASDARRDPLRLQLLLLGQERLDVLVALPDQASDGTSRHLHEILRHLGHTVGIRLLDLVGAHVSSPDGRAPTLRPTAAPMLRVLMVVQVNS